MTQKDIWMIWIVCYKLVLVMVNQKEEEECFINVVKNYMVFCTCILVKWFT